MSLLKEGKELVEYCTKLINFQLDTVKKKLKIYGIQKKIDIEMNKLGEIVYSLFQGNKEDILKDKQITGLVNSISSQNGEIKNTEEEIVNIHSNFQEAKEKIYIYSRDVLEKIKMRSSYYKAHDSKIKTKVSQSKTLDKKMSNIEEGKEEEKEAKETTKTIKDITKETPESP